MVCKSHHETIRRTPEQSEDSLAQAGHSDDYISEGLSFIKYGCMPPRKNKKKLEEEEEKDEEMRLEKAAQLSRRGTKDDRGHRAKIAQEPK